MDGIQLALNLRKIQNKTFYISLISAGEIEDENKLFDSIFEKPLPLKKMAEIYNNNLHLNKNKLYITNALTNECSEEIIINTNNQDYNKSLDIDYINSLNLIKFKDENINSETIVEAEAETIGVIMKHSILNYDEIQILEI